MNASSWINLQSPIFLAFCTWYDVKVLFLGSPDLWLPLLAQSSCLLECQSFRPLSCSAPFPFGLLPVRPPSIHKVIRSEVSWVTWHVDLFGLYQRSPAQPCELTSALIVMVIHKLSSTLQPLVSEMTCSSPISDSLFAPQSSPVCKCCLAYSC